MALLKKTVKAPNPRPSAEALRQALGALGPDDRQRVFAIAQSLRCSLLKPIDPLSFEAPVGRSRKTLVVIWRTLEALAENLALGYRKDLDSARAGGCRLPDFAEGFGRDWRLALDFWLAHFGAGFSPATLAIARTLWSEFALEPTSAAVLAELRGEDETMTEILGAAEKGLPLSDDDWLAALAWRPRYLGEA